MPEAFLQHYNWERPHQGRSCGNVPPRVAFPVLPPLPALPERVNPDQRLTTLDHQGFLRRVGRDGCVDVDLRTSSISSHMAGRQICLQVEAAERHCVVWHADQGVTTLPIKGLMVQEMGIEESLTHLKQESLAHARRSPPHVPWNLRQLPLWETRSESGRFDAPGDPIRRRAIGGTGQGSFVSATHKTRLERERRAILAMEGRMRTPFLSRESSSLA